VFVRVMYILSVVVVLHKWLNSVDVRLFYGI